MKNNIIEFIGQHLFIGIDVHKKSWTISIILQGVLIKKYSMNPYPEELVKSLKKNYPPGAKYHTVYEAGFCGYWVDRKLKEAGINNIIVNPADVPTTHKEKKKKNR